VFVPEVGCSRVGLLKRVVYHLTHTLVPDTAAAMDALSQEVQRCEQNGQSIVLMLDDWPTDADRDMLAELRWLLNLDLEGRRLGLLLSGFDVQPEAHWPAWLTQRLLTTAALGPLTSEQVPAYLEHRLRAATAKKVSGTFFEPAAAELIATWSGGVPRLINRAAHLALHVACLDLAPRVERDAVARALERLAPPPRTSTESAHAAPAEVLGAAT
jgi:type II secretory pathway predicted ATPase ExeA